MSTVPTIDYERIKGVKNVPLEELYTSGHRTCQGCESATTMRGFIKSAGPRTVVTGATGRQGGAVARHLLDEGYRVRGVTRSPDSKQARKLASLGADMVRADMASPDDMRRACAGAHGVFSVQNPMISGEQGELAHVLAGPELGLDHAVLRHRGRAAHDDERLSADVALPGQLGAGRHRDLIGRPCETLQVALRARREERQSGQLICES